MESCTLHDRKGVKVVSLQYVHVMFMLSKTLKSEVRVVMHPTNYLCTAEPHSSHVIQSEDEVVDL